MLSYTDLAVTPAEATAYLTASGVTGWPTTQGEQETALMRGQRYIAARYNARWLDEWQNAEAPDAVKYAICEAALAEAKSAGSLSVTSTPASDKVLVQVGSLQWERVKGASGADGWIPRLSAVEGLLAGIVGASAANVTWVNRA